MKNELITDMMVALMDMPQSDLARVRDALIRVLDKYEVTEKETALTVYDDTDARILKKYSACLYVEGKSELTAEAYLREIKAFKDSMGISLKETTTNAVRVYLATQRASGASSTTLYNKKQYLSALFGWMKVEGYIASNPCDGVGVIKKEKKEKMPFSDDEIDRLRKACQNKKETAVVEFLMSSGVRVSELINMDISDVDFNTLKVLVRNGKGGKDRITYINAGCAKALIEYLNSRTDSDAALIVSNRGRITKSGIEWMVKDIASRANVSDCHPHRFRRTLASKLVYNDMGVENVQKILGHTNISTTMIYVNADQSRVEKEYRKCCG